PRRGSGAAVPGPFRHVPPDAVRPCAERAAVAGFVQQRRLSGFAYPGTVPCRTVDVVGRSGAYGVGPSPPTMSPVVPRRYRSETFFLQLLAKAVAAKARDIHLKVGQPPGARVRGEIVYFRLDKVT